MLKPLWKANNDWRTRKKANTCYYKSKQKTRGFTSKDVDHKGNVIFNELAKEKFDKIELTDEINQNDLIYYFKGSSARKRFDDFKNGIKHFEKIRLD